MGKSSHLINDALWWKSVLTLHFSNCFSSFRDALLQKSSFLPIFKQLLCFLVLVSLNTFEAHQTVTRRAIQTETDWETKTSCFNFVIAFNGCQHIYCARMVFSGLYYIFICFAFWKLQNKCEREGEMEREKGKKLNYQLRIGIFVKVNFIMMRFIFRWLG